MPAINVARTDTFEIQRQKINQIGSTLFNVTAGGSDLATGNLKIGNGTKQLPSLAFTSEPSVGIYKPLAGSIGFSSNSKILADFTPETFISYKNFEVQRNSLSTSGLITTNPGLNYDPGSYSNIPVSGGTGEKGQLNISVTEYVGTITTSGYGYTAGTYSDVSLSGGSGTEARATFTVDPILGTVSNAGSGYVPGTYVNVPLAGGNGAGATGDFLIVGETNITGTTTNSGSGYTNGTYSNVPLYNIPTTTYAVTVVSNPGTPPPDNIFAINGVNQDTLTLVKGNTYWFDVSDATNGGHPFTFQQVGGGFLSISDYSVRLYGTGGDSGALVQLVIKPSAPTETIEYACSVHAGMGGTINIVDGAAGSYGTNASANITISGGAISLVEITSPGNDYKQNDALTIVNGDVGGTGTGFQYVLNAPTYTGVVDTFSINSNGANYLQGDVLGVNDADVGSGGGSGFAFTISNDPSGISSFVFSNKGIGYQVGDVLTIPESVENISTTLKGTIAATASITAGSPIITIPDTTGIQAGMNVNQPAFITDVGKIAFNVTVVSVDSATQITLSDDSTATGSGDLEFSTSGDVREISVASVSGIQQGFSVVKVSGDGSVSSTTTVSGVNANLNTIVLSEDPTAPGPVVLTFVPPWGDPTTTDFSFTIDALGVVEEASVAVAYGGLGYSEGDNLTISPELLTQEIEYTVEVKDVNLITFSAAVPDNAFAVGDQVKIRDGNITGITITTDPGTISTGTYSNRSASGGTGNGATFDIEALPTGSVNVSINSAGYGYTLGDSLTISGIILGGSSPADDVVLEVSTIFTSTDLEVYSKEVSGGNIVSATIQFNSDLESGQFLVVSGTTSPAYELNTVSSQEYRYFIDDGNGLVQTPDLTFYVNNTYKLNTSDSSNSLHEFSFSSFRDGKFSPSNITGVNGTLVANSKDVLVDDATGILPGMEVIQGLGSGGIPNGTLVESVLGNTVTITEFPTTPGTAELSFVGTEYTDNVTRSGDSISIKITDSTPNLYYYCKNHPNMGGHDNNEALITADPNNPKVFGSGLLFTIDELAIDDVVSANVETGELVSVSLTSTDATITDATISGTLTSPNIIGVSATLSSITAVSNQNIGVSAANVNFISNVNIGSTITAERTSGNITTSGYVKTLDSLNVNDFLTITDNIIASTTNNDVLVSPSANRVAKVDSTTALVVPVGTTQERPGAAIRQNGAIRFNTDNNQYEGYTATTSSWSSLGGVRDIDGNTYILAELTAGANDNTLWFYNDGTNTARLTTQFLDFRSVKQLSSGKLGLPTFIVWSSNIVVTTGQYVKHKNNLYEVTAGGTTATDGSEPVHTSGVQNNGTAQFTWYSLAVSPLSFNEIEELRVAPNKDAPLIVNASLKLGGTTSDDWNTISTITEDLTLRPNPGKKVVIDSYTHLAIPAGNNNQKNTASAVPGSIRFNTEIQQFEGYSGTNWSSLGGVRDVDGNTYIIPETAPAANENILYFYNDNLNTMQLSKTSLDFTNIDTITTSGLSNLSLDTPLVTLNLNETSIDNRDVNRTFISSSKQYLDLGLSSGLNVDPILRLDDQGDVYLNTTFGTGTFNGVKVFDGELKEFELADYALRTSAFALAKGGAESSGVVLYSSSSNKGCKVTVVSKSSSGKRSMAEYSVIDNGTDIIFNEYGSLNTSLDQYNAVFDYNATGDVRITLTLSDDHANGDIINFTVLTQVIK